MNTASLEDNLRLVRGGPEFFDCLREMIDNAEEELHLQTFIFADDSTGRPVLNALKAAAQRGVRVLVLVDGYGGALPAGVLEELRQAGVEARLFAPWLSWSSLHFGRRLHHKVVVADKRILLIGGINIANKYHGTAEAQAWLDFAVRFESPRIGREVAALCDRIYQRRHGIQRRSRIWDSCAMSGDVVTVLQNDWLLRKNQIYRSYLKNLAHARNEIIIVGTYFLPGRRLTRVLRQVGSKQVRVRLILAGMSDVKILRRATAYLYRSLLGNGVELFEWPHSVLHGKAAVADGRWATVGSFNLNQLSAYGSIEMNAEVISDQFGKTATNAFEEVIAQCNPVTLESLNLRENWRERLLNWASYQIMRISLQMLTFTSYRRIWTAVKG
ncbi:MAG: phospholipase D-like domain-containing protein [Bacteroidia bacterium]